MNKINLSSSRVKTFLHCRMQYYWEYIEELTPKTKSFPLKVGDIVHQLLTMWDHDELSDELLANPWDFVAKNYPDDDEEKVHEVAMEATRLVAGYIEHWKGDDLKVISSETWLEVEMPEYVMTCRVDGIARPQNGKLWRLERKTAGKMDSYYLKGLKGGLQGSMYDFAIEHTFKEKVEGTVYDILVKTKVPQYDRNFTQINYAQRERMLKCLDGVVRDIKAGDFYPSCDCFLYNSTCPFLPLCNYDSEGVRKAFYKKRTSPIGGDNLNKSNKKEDAICE